METIRLISGFTIAVLIFLGILYLPSNLLVHVLSVIVSVSFWELLRLRFPLIVSTVTSLLLLTVFFLLPFSPVILKIFVFLGTFLWISMGALILIFPHNKGLIQQRFFWFLSGLLIHICFWSSVVLILFSSKLYPLQALGITFSTNLSLIVLISISALMDSIAYFAGRKFGKRKLLPNISPNKTLEGVLTSIFLTPLIIIIPISFLSSPKLLPLVFIIFIVCIFSVIGDATASLFKRIAGVKDSSNLIPGHGGMLDRIDSHLAAVPIFLFCIYIYEIL